jgi:spore maturation protein CgeB
MNLPRRRRILCVCDPRPGQTSSYRLRSLRRLGQEVVPFDTTQYHARSRYLQAIAFRAPVGPLIHHINRDLVRTVRKWKPDVVFFDKPIQFTRRTILKIKRTGATTVYFNQDNPFGPRRDACWYQLRRVFRLFDLHCAIRNADAVRFREWGIPYVQVMFTFEPSAHFPPPSDWSDEQRPRAVSFVGAPYEERPQFLLHLGEEERIPLTIGGALSWKNALSPEMYDRYVHTGPLFDSAYREAIWRSRINLSFLTRLNEDDIALKSPEIAACQGFLLALRCPGHQAIFEEDREAVFFSSVEECADKCRFYLERPELRETIARRGRERAIRSGYDNDTQMARILDHLDGVR